MKTIEVDDELYHYIASRTQAIGETASDILRRLLRLPSSPQPFVLVQQNTIDELKELAKPKAKIKKEEAVEKGTQKLEKMLKSDDFINEPKNVVRFLMLLSALHQIDPLAFSKATQIIKGTERTYFATNEQELLAHGSSVKAKQIPNSPFWVVTNNNTQRKGLIVTGIMESMELPKVLIEHVRAIFA